VNAGGKRKDVIDSPQSELFPEVGGTTILGPLGKRNRRKPMKGEGESYFMIHCKYSLMPNTHITKKINKNTRTKKQS